MLITTEEEQLENITEFFKDHFCGDELETTQKQPARMKPTFSGKEVVKAQKQQEHWERWNQVRIYYGPEALPNQITSMPVIYNCRVML